MTGPDIDAVAFQYATPWEGSETVMVTVVAPTSAEAEEVVRALTGTEPPS